MQLGLLQGNDRTGRMEFGGKSEILGQMPISCDGQIKAEQIPAYGDPQNSLTCEVCDGVVRRQGCSLFI
jgi:hypothetical protein